ncbi:MAG: hypothetical protein AB7T22_02375 [Calditrichaceae bacterium]
MEPLYSSMAIVVGFLVMIVLIYLSYGWRQEHIHGKRAENLKKNDYFNAKEYYRSYLTSIIQQIGSGELLWVEIFPSNEPANRLLINKLPESESLSLIFRVSVWDLNDRKRVMALGAESVFQKVSGIMIQIPFNSKIATDIIYYIFEESMSMVRIFNLKFKF